jgi:outer membrane protein assembly factor BamA
LTKKQTYLIPLFLFLCLSGLSQQKNIELKIINTDQAVIFKKITFKNTFPNKEKAFKELQIVYQSLINEGYLTTSFDSIIQRDSSNIEAFLNIGKLYRWTKLSVPKEYQYIVSKIGYSEKVFLGRIFKPYELNQFMEKIIIYLENNGYPFASSKLDSINIDGEQINAKLKIEKNIFVKLDSLILEGNQVTSIKFISRYLGIKNNMPFNENAYQNISTKLKQLPFLIEKKAPILRLTDKQNKLYLFLEKKNASQFDGIVGLLPNEKGKTVFTGDVKIKLVNALLKNAETIDINWRRLQSQTQDLKARIIYPYIIGLPIGLDYGIKLYKRDTTFIDINNTIGFNYYYQGLNHFKVFYKQRNANLISTSGLETITVLPEYADINTQSYGLGWFYENLDYRFNPRKGISISVQGSVGNRVIKRNPKVNELAYQNIQLKTSQYQADGELSTYIPLIKNNILKLSANFGSVFGNNLYRNELHRIGGLKSLRGFDEESIFASTFIIPSIEYRFIFEKNSNFFVFADGCWYENSSNNNYINDTPFGFGAGMNFDTKAGIFNLSYGIGKQMGNHIDFRTGKIHAGLIALF